MKENKTTKSKKERRIGLIHVALLFVLSTAICCTCLYYYNISTRTISQKKMAINKMERMRSFQNLQRDKVEIIDSVYQKINSFKPGIYASYDKSDIKYNISSIRNLYEQNSSDERYKVFLHIADFYEMWFIDKQEIWAKEQNIRFLEQNLNDCNMGVEKKLMELNAIVKK